MSEQQDIPNAVLHVLLVQQGETLKEIRNDVRTQNGRVYALESDVAVLQDRSAQARDGHARYAGWGGVITGLGSLIWQFFHKP